MATASLQRTREDRQTAARWKERRFDLGVTGFTLFFTFFNVVFSNLLAFALALHRQRWQLGHGY